MGGGCGVIQRKGGPRRLCQQLSCTDLMALSLPCPACHHCAVLLGFGSCEGVGS